MRITTSTNNFARGQIDHNLQGRFELPLTQTAAERCINFYTNFQGNAMFRTGSEYIFDIPSDCYIAEFKFNFQQSYLLFFMEKKIRFASFDANNVFGWVLSGGTPLEVVSPYTLAESKDLQFAQNADVMYLVHPSHAPRKLVRASASSFTLNTFDFTDGPYLPVDTSGVTLTPSATSGSITITASSAFFTSANVGQLIRLSYVVDSATKWYWGKITAFTDTTHVTFSVLGTALPATTAATSFRMGAFYTNNYPAALTFHKTRLYYAATPTKITTIYGSKVALYDDFTEGTTDDAGLNLTCAVISEKILWLASGSRSLLAGTSEGIVSISNSDGTSLTPTDAEASKVVDVGASNTIPVRKDGLMFYVDSTKRKLYSFSYDLLTERYVADNINIVSYDITLGGISQLRRVRQKNDLLYTVRADGRFLTLNFSETEKISGWHQHITDGEVKQVNMITDNFGNEKMFLMVKRGSAYRLEMLTDYVDFALRSDFYTDNTSADDDDVAYNRYVAEQLRNCCYLDCAYRYDRLQSNAITFDGVDKITATTDVFSAGNVGNEIVYKTDTGYEYGHFQITAYIDAKNVNVIKINGNPSANTYTDWYLTFSTLSGLTIFNGKTVSVCADGGYLGNFAITDGTIDLGRQVSSVVVGLPYYGEIKTMKLGFAVQGENTQITSKNVYKITLRLSYSAGGLVGTDKYNMQTVQLFNPAGLYNLPPIPIDGDVEIGYDDATSPDKAVFIEQKEPLPFEINSLFIEAKYEIKV